MATAEAVGATWATEGDGNDDGPGILRVAALDEHPLFLDGLAALIAGSPDMALTVRATSVAELMPALRAAEVDVLVMEPWGPSGDGLMAIAQAAAAHPSMVVVALSWRCDPSHVKQVVANGARGYVSKAASGDDLPAILRHIVAGATVVPSGSAGGPIAWALTPRELEVLALAADGKSNAQVGSVLFVTEQTVKFHLSNIYRKIGAANRTEAARIGRREGLIA